MGELGVLRRARQAGLESRYADPATGIVSIPRIGPLIDEVVTDSVSGPGYRRITDMFRDGTIKNFMKKPYVKPTLAGVAALAAFGFIYRKRKKERSQEEIQGPPLLPGGSAYETAYPGNSLNIPFEDPMMGSTENGVTYRVNVSGDYEQTRQFAELAQGMAANSSAVFYDGLRDPSESPYSLIPSMF